VFGFRPASVGRLLDIVEIASPPVGGSH